MYAARQHDDAVGLAIVRWAGRNGREPDEADRPDKQQKGQDAADHDKRALGRGKRLGNRMTANVVNRPANARGFAPCRHQIRPITPFCAALPAPSAAR